MSTNTLTLTQMENELDSLVRASCLTMEARQAAQHASELLRAIRSSLDLDWDSEARDLHKIGCNVEPNEWLKKQL